MRQGLAVLAPVPEPRVFLNSASMDPPTGSLKARLRAGLNTILKGPQNALVLKATSEDTNGDKIPETFLRLYARFVFHLRILG